MKNSRKSQIWDKFKQPFAKFGHLMALKWERWCIIHSNIKISRHSNTQKDSARVVGRLLEEKIEKFSPKPGEIVIGYSPVRKTGSIRDFYSFGYCNQKKWWGKRDCNKMIMIPFREEYAALYPNWNIGYKEPTNKEVLKSSWRYHYQKKHPEVYSMVKIGDLTGIIVPKYGKRSPVDMSPWLTALYIVAILLNALNLFLAILRN